MAQKIKEENLRMNILVNGDEVKKKLGDMKKQIREGADEVKKLTAEKDKLIAKYGSESVEVKRLNEQLGISQNRLNTNREALKKMEDELNLSTYSIQELRKHMREVNALLSQTKPNTKEWTKYNKELQATKKRLDLLRGGADSVSSSLKSMVTRYFTIGTAVSLLSRVTRSAVETVRDFEQENVNLSTILGTNIEQIKLLTDNALDLGRHTRYTASQVTGLQTELAKLGFTQTQILDMSSPTLNFATAVGTDLSSAASLAGATLRIFGLASKDTEDALDVLATATNKSALDFSYLQEAMSTVGPVANSFGFSLRDTTALLGTLSNAGFDASSAATATRNILLNLADSSGKLATALGGPVRTFPELMEGLITLRDRGIDLNEALELTDKRSVAAFSSFLSGSEAAIALRDALEDVGGELERIASERANTLQGALDGLRSAWEGLMLAFKFSAGPIKTVVQGLTELLNRITDIFSGDKATIWEVFLGPLAGGALGTQIRKIQARKKSKKNNAPPTEVTEDDIYGVWPSQTSASGESAGHRGSPAGSGSKGANGSKSSAGGTGSRTRTWSLENDEAFLTAKAALIEKYNNGEIATQEAFDEQLYQLEIASLTARLALHKEKGSERGKLESDLQAKIKAHKEKMVQREAELVKFQDSLETDKTRIAINAENRRYEEQIKAYKKLKGAINVNDSDIEKMKARHARNLLDIELDRINRMRSLASQEHANEIASLRNEYSNKLLTIKNGSAKEKEEIREQNLKIAEMDVKYFQEYVDEIQKMIAEAEANTTGASEEETRSTLADLKAKLQDAFAKLYAAQEIINGENEGLLSGSGRGDLFGVSPDQWDTLFERLRNGTMQANDLSTILEGIGGAAAEGMNIASMAIDKTNAKEQKAFDEYRKQNDKKRNILDDRLKAGLMSQAQYDKEIEDMQKEEDAKEEEMKLQQAKRDKAMAVTQATIDGALSVAKTFAAFPWPASLIPAGIAAGLAAAQVALIASTPISTGYAAGGYVTRAQDGRKFPARLSPDKRGFVSGPTILVGEAGGEYVIPADGLQNPSLAPFIGSIETARKMGTLRSINFGSLYPAAQVAAFATGGYTERSGGVSTVVAGSNEDILERMERIIEKMDNRPPVEVPLLGRRGIRAAEEKYERYKNNGRI